MIQSGFFVPQNEGNISFPPQQNQELPQNSTYQNMSINSFSPHQNIKIQSNNNYQNYSYFQDFDNKNKSNAHDQEQSQGLFQIQKKRKKQKYKRSTNNSHKKFISAIRRLFYAVISTKQKQQFQTKYCKFRSCRTFFFIILAYMKNRFSSKLLNSVRVGFINEMKIKINQYQEEINRTKNMNLKNFREEEIIDIKYSIKSCNQYFNGNTRQAIQCMYKKDKSTVIKRQHYQSALRSVHLIQKQLLSDHKQLLEEPYIEDYSPSSDREKVERKVIKREIRQNQNAKFALEKQEAFDYGSELLDNDRNFFSNFKKTEFKKTNDTQYFDDSDEGIQKSAVQQKEVLYPPLLESIPYIKYDPFNPPFKYKRETKNSCDVRQDFFGFLNFGFPKFYEKNVELFGMSRFYPAIDATRTNF